MSPQEEYLSEGIKWQSVDYTDNYECLELIAGKPVGLLSLLDEECRYVCLCVCPICVCVCLFCMCLSVCLSCMCLSVCLSCMCLSSG